MRSMWSGMISFGLVNIPVQLYPMTKPSRINFNLLRQNDLCPIGYKKVCRKTGEEVSNEEIVKGYEYQKGDYIILDEDDFKKVDVEHNYAIVIEDFVDDKDVDMKYAETPYYLEPDKKSKNVYILFREALKKSGRAGIGKFVLRTKEHLVILRVQNDALVLNTLRYQREFRDASELDFPKASKIPKNQMELALELIEKLSGKFNPEKYQDTYNQNLESIIEAKKKGIETKVQTTKPGRTETPDIVSRLKESLAKAGSK